MQAHMGFAIHKTQTHQATQRQDMLLVSIFFIDSMHHDSRCPWLVALRLWSRTIFCGLSSRNVARFKTVFL